MDPPTQLTLGKSQVVRLPFPVARLIVGGQPGGRAGRAAGAAPAMPGQPAQAVRPAPGASRSGGGNGVAEADVTLLSPTELFFLGRETGSMNVVLQASDGHCLVKDLVVTVDAGTLQATLKELMPDESGIRIRSAEDSLVLTGSVLDAVKLQQVLALATSYADTKKVINLLQVNAPQQVMLEVQIAEVSKNLLDRLGSASAITRRTDGGANTFSVASNFLSNGGGLLQFLRKGHTALNLDGEFTDGVVRVLAEPNIMAISGQTASFLSGGKIFIPVAQDRDRAGVTITLEEKEFGVGLKFTPTVLNGRINLKVVSEVSELSQTGTPFTTIGNVTAILPSMTTRRVDTTVQLGDGQSFVVAGLIKNNVTQSLDKFPGLGDTPVIGALFRSTEFQNDKTELMFVVTPRLVRPVTTPLALPTDNHVVPSRSEVILKGTGEGPDPALRPAATPAPKPGPAPSSGAAPAPLVAPPPAAQPAPVRPVSMLGRGGQPLTIP
ncbi:type II and III secretion system protein family protein [Ramlibacter tataouinensis]|uniref:type II and III secretion system protein family protein n=1 Tax=Ramlibacter tataouinensis TaxID=94132 RepID=UPI0022F3AD38|nr:type II and III secretion system protein family protein [Ramlibacter tataouinensis]WBY02599.1 type II and III secretion system protein family protein [Ramlibacter tataouinensis]